MYRIREYTGGDSVYEVVVEKGDLETARQRCHELAEEYDPPEPEDGTMWLQYIIDRSTDEPDEWEYVEEFVLRIDPEEPPCVDADDHDWQAPVEIVGGIEENPGVFGNGGGVVIVDVCLRCGCRRTKDTWARNPVTGDEGATRVSYDPEYYAAEVEQYRCDKGL